MAVTREIAISCPHELLNILYSSKEAILNLDLSMNYIRWKVNWPNISYMKIQGNS